MVEMKISTNSFSGISEILTNIMPNQINVEIPEFDEDGKLFRWHKIERVYEVEFIVLFARQMHLWVIDERKSYGDIYKEFTTTEIGDFMFDEFHIRTDVEKYFIKLMLGIYSRLLY